MDTSLIMWTLSDRIHKKKQVNPTMKAGLILQFLDEEFHNLQRNKS